MPSPAVLTLAAAVGLLPAAAPARTQVYYCGSVSYRAEETGRYALDRTFPDGERHRATRQLSRLDAGTWGVCLRCPPVSAGVPLLACGAEGTAPFTHTHARHGTSDHLAAAEGCGRTVARPGARTERDDGEEDGGAPARLHAEVSLNAVEGEYTVSLVSETTAEAVRRSWLDERTTSPCGPASPPQHRRDEVRLPVLVVFQSEPLPWTGGEEVSGRQEVLEGGEGRTFCREPAEQGETCSHRSATTFAWRLARKETDCTVEVTRAEGEATLNGAPLPTEGPVPLAPGDLLRTGGRARLELRPPGGTSLYRFGSDTLTRFARSPCDHRPTKDATAQLVTGWLYVLVAPVVGADARFEIGNENTVAPGVRGSLERLLDLVRPARAWAVDRPAEPAGATADPPLEAAALPEGWPASGSAAALSSGPGGAVGVKALRGSARVDDPAAPAPVRLTAGKVYRGPAVARPRPVAVTLGP